MIRKLLLSAFTAMLSGLPKGMAIGAETGSGICQSAGVWKGLIKTSVGLYFSNAHGCRLITRRGCTISASMLLHRSKWGPRGRMATVVFQPVKIVEVVQSPWCSPFLEGVSLQSSSFDMGKGATNRPKGNEAGFYDVHLWEFPITVMLKLLIMGIVPLSLILTHLLPTLVK